MQPMLLIPFSRSMGSWGLSSSPFKYLSPDLTLNFSWRPFMNIFLCIFTKVNNLPKRLNKDRQVNDLNFKQFVAIVTFCFLLSCKGNPEQLTEIHGQQLTVDASISQTDSILGYVAPFRQRIDQVLDSTLSHAPEPLLLDDGTRNTSLGNLIADIVFEETAPIFRGRTGLDLDFVVLNQGGLRSIVPAGPVTARNAYEVMPFENFIVVVELNGTAMLDLIDFLSKSWRGHPISGIQIKLDKNGSLESVDIHGMPFD